MNLKAILNVHPKSQYAEHNGMTFSIVEMLSAGDGLNFCLDIYGDAVDFTWKEVLVVDFSHELQMAYDSFNWDSGSKRGAHYRPLEKYGKLKGIKFTPEYNCPA